MMAGYLSLQFRDRMGRWAEYVTMTSMATQGDSKAIKKLLKKLNEEAQ